MIMTDNEKRIEIAKLSGWKVLPPNIEQEFDITGEPPDWESKRYHRVPDYMNDLNAIHGAEKTLNDDIEKRNAFAIHLKKQSNVSPTDFFSIHATADKRADAFLIANGFEI